MRTLRDPNSKGHQHTYFRLLLALWLLFLFRVIVQALQKWSPVDIFPAFDRWYSGALAYGWLLSAQLIILILMARVVVGFLKGMQTPNRRYGQWFIGIGMVYFGVMLVRLILGLTIAIDHPWLGMTIPAVFHLVLALFLLVMGHFHVQNSSAGEPA
jgi:hypothetical protein